MTYDEAVTAIRATYDEGAEDIYVSDEMFKAYSDGLVANEREGGTPTRVPWLAFKSAKVRLTCG